MANITNLPGIGIVYNEGKHVKRPYLIPSSVVYARNLKLEILNSQVEIFSEVERTDGVTLDKDNGDYFNTDSVHLGVFVRDPNRLVIWIDYRQIISRKRLGSRNGKLELDIIVGVGVGNEIQVAKSDLSITALMNFFYTLPPEKLIVGWPANIDTAKQEAYQPEIKCNSEEDIELNPDRSKGAVANLGALGAIGLNYSLTYKKNIFTNL